jgi:predicted nucleotidyltransferase
MPYLEEIKTGLNTLKPELSAKFHVNTIGLFGSIVRSDFSPATSDIDIIVDFSQPVGIEFIDLANYLESKFQRKIDLVSRGGIKPRYYSAIEKDIVYV